MAVLCCVVLRCVMCLYRCSSHKSCRQSDNWRNISAQQTCRSWRRVVYRPVKIKSSDSTILSGCQFLTGSSCFSEYDLIASVWGPWPNMSMWKHFPVLMQYEHFSDRVKERAFRRVCVCICACLFVCVCVHGGGGLRYVQENWNGNENSS